MHATARVVPHRLTSRLVIRVLGALTLMLSLALVPTAPGARASADWCWDDPVVAVDGRLLDIRVQMPVANVLTMRSTTLTVIIPTNVRGAVVLDDVSAFPMRTTITATGPAWSGNGRLPITIVVSVIASTSYPIRVVATPILTSSSPRAMLSPATAEGTANSVVKLPLSVGR